MQRGEEKLASSLTFPPGFRTASDRAGIEAKDIPLSFSGFLVGSRLLTFSSNIEQRLYPQWATRVLNLPTLPRGEAHSTNDPIEQTVSQSLIHHA